MGIDKITAGNSDASMWGDDAPSYAEKAKETVRPTMADEGSYTHPEATKAPVATSRSLARKAIDPRPYWGPSRHRRNEPDTPEGLTYSA